MYAFPRGNGPRLIMEKIGTQALSSKREFTGLVQFAKVHSEKEGVDSEEVEALLDRSAGNYCRAVSVSASTKNARGLYQLHFSQGFIDKVLLR